MIIVEKISNEHKISEIFTGNIYLLKVIDRHIYIPYEEVAILNMVISI